MTQLGAIRDAHPVLDGGSQGPPFSSSRPTVNARRFTQQAVSLALITRGIPRRQEASAGGSQASATSAASQDGGAALIAPDPVEASIRRRLQQALEGAGAGAMPAAPEDSDPGLGQEEAWRVPADFDPSPGVRSWLEPSVQLRDEALAWATPDPILFEPALEPLFAPEPAPLPAPAPSPGVDPVPPLYVEGPGDGDPVSPNDVQQRDIGNCYLMAAIMAVADQDPEAIRRLITDNGDGTFDVRLFSPEHGDWLTYRVTQAELQNTTGGSPDLRRAGTGDGELWVRVIEAAYAQHLDALDNGPLNGTELMTRGGYPIHAMVALTGRPAGEYRRNLGDVIIGAVQAGRPVVVTTANSWSDVKDPDGDNLGPMELAARHAYQVVSAYQDPNNGKWIVVLANPWGLIPPQQDGLNPGEIYLQDALDQGLITSATTGSQLPPPPPPRYYPPARLTVV